MQFVQYLCTLPSNDTYGYIQALPLAKVYVYVWDPVTGGSGAPALLYDDLGGAISNPVIADINGFAGFAAEDGIYNIQVTDADGVRNAPLAVAVQFFDQQDFAEVAGIVGQAVIGPNSSADGHIPQFDGATGNKVKDNGLLLDIDGTLGANSDTRIPSQKAVKTAIAAAFGANDAMIFKGVIDCSGNPNYPAADAGHTYRVSVAGKIGGASGVNVEVGDLLICLTDGTVSGNQATVGSAWTIAQANIDGAVVGPASASDGNLAMFNGTTGKLLKDGGNTLANPLIYPNGSAAAPSAVWNTNNGLFWDSTNSAVGITIGGVQAGFIGAAGISIFSSNSATVFNTQAFSDGGNMPVLAMIRGRGTYTSPAVPQTGDNLGSLRFRGYAGTGPTFGTGAEINAIVEETTWGTTANGTYIRFRACADGASTLTEIARFNVANGLQMFGANPVIDADRAFRPRSTTISGAITPALSGRVFYHSDAQGGVGDLAIDTGSAYRHPGQAAVKKLTTAANATYTPRIDGRVIRDTATLAADKSLTLLTTNVTDGHKVELSRRGSSGGFNRQVYQADGVTLIANVADNASADFIYDGVVGLWFQK